MIKKLTSILLVVMLLATLTPSVIFAAETTDSIVAEYGSYVRGRTYEVNGTIDADKVFSGSDIMYTKTTNSTSTENDYISFLTFNLSSYEANLCSASSVNLKLKAGRYSGNYAYSFDVYVLSDSADDLILDGTSLTWNSLSTNNIAKSGTLIDSNEKTISNGNYFTSVDIKDSLINALNENPSNSYVSFMVRATGSDLTTFYGYKNHSILINYDNDSVDNQAYISSKVDGLGWSDISEVPSDAITDNLTLPSKLYGANVTWSSNNEAVIASDGTVTASKGDAKDVTLTATLNYNGAEATKAFAVTVPAITATTEVIDDLYASHTRADYDKNNVYQGNIAQSTSQGYYYTEKTGFNKSNDRYIFVKFDVKDFTNKILNADKIKFTISGQIENTNTFSISLLPNTLDNWDTSLTYDSSYEKGMLSDDGVITIANGVSAKDSPFVSDDISSHIKNALLANPDNSELTFRIYADSSLVQFRWPVIQLLVDYYESDIDANAFFEEKKDTLAWENITTQSINNVVADLKLPSQFYGFDVTWSSSDDTAINSAGEVTVSGTKTPVTLTATITDGSNTYIKEFKVTVSDKKYEIAFTNETGSAAKVYAAENANAVLVFATYSGNELLKVVPVPAEIVKGETMVNSTISTSGASEIKIMLLSDMDNLTPLCISKTK